MKKTRNKLYASMGLALFFALAGAAWAGDCGDAVPCSCGDNVVDDRKLVSGEDPILAAACPEHGLIMNTDGVTLDLDGNKIMGSGDGVGVRILDVTGVTIRNGKIQNFGKGISTNSSITEDSVIEKIKAYKNSKAGMNINGHFNLLEKNSAIGNDGHGIKVEGDENELIKNKADKNEKDGINVQGEGNVLEKNKAKKNKGDGIFVDGVDNIDDGGNKGKKNGGVDCEIDGGACL